MMWTMNSLLQGTTSLDRFCITGTQSRRCISTEHMLDAGLVIAVEGIGAMQTLCGVKRKKTGPIYKDWYMT